MRSIRHKIQKPDYRNNGKYQFITNYTGTGAVACAHLSVKEISERCRVLLGDGTLMDDGVDLWWEQTVEGEEVACPQCGNPTTEFTEGVCTTCAATNQSELDEHNARQSWWNKLSDKARDLIIQDAMRKAP